MCHTLTNIRNWLYDELLFQFFIAELLNTLYPTSYRTRQFFNNFTTNEDITTTTDTSLFISHTTNVLLFKFRCNNLIGFRIIKEMQGSVASWTPCTLLWETQGSQCHLSPSVSVCNPPGSQLF
jgi:hypothetical protein